MSALAPDLSAFPVREWTVDEVMAMVDQGILRPEDHLELLEGRLVAMVPQGPPHSSDISDLNLRLTLAYPAIGHVRVQCPLDVDRRTQPEPDLAVARGRPGAYRDRHPRGPDTLLVIEVARTSQAVDRAKAPIYARAGVPVYWIVDLAAERLELREGPEADGSWRITRLLRRGESVPLPGLDASWDVAELFLADP